VLRRTTDVEILNMHEKGASCGMAPVPLRNADKNARIEMI